MCNALARNAQTREGVATRVLCQNTPLSLSPRPLPCAPPFQFLKVMVVGGPNVRKDYHIQAGEEFFWQLKGTLNLHVVMNGKFQTITVPGE